MSSYLVKWNTARLINKELHDLKFFNGYENIHKDLYDVYKSLVKYAGNYSDIRQLAGNAYGVEKDIYEEWIEYLDKTLEFQKFVSEKDDNTDPKEIADRAKQVFDNKHVAEAYSADLHILKQLDLLLEYSESVKNLFNFIKPLIKLEQYLISDYRDLYEPEIRQILETKGLDTFTVPEELLINQ